MLNKTEEAEQLAGEIWKLCREKLLAELPFFENILVRLPCSPMRGPGLMTDGRKIFYYPFEVIKRFREEKEGLLRDYLHMVLHGIFRHMNMTPSTGRLCWDLACDIAVESVISGLSLPVLDAGRALQQEDFIRKLQKEEVPLTAAGIYRYLTENRQQPEKLCELCGIFHADNHDCWYMTEAEKETASGESDSDRESWEDLPEELFALLQSPEHQLSESTGRLVQNIEELRQNNSYDYTAFLRTFAVPDEVMKINPEEFDYIFYTYGLQKYRNMPLIEPLEYQEVKRIREFVVAIDTSGSTSGELVRQFVQKTYHILKTADSFAARVHLRLIQCDCQIREDVKITKEEELERYLQGMQLKGMGSTDFRPVFAHVRQLIQKKELLHLNGLIYFTDGFGEFPAEDPGYPTAFVYLAGSSCSRELPHWALRLVLQPDAEEGGDER